MAEKIREPQMDVLRGIGIILIVLGHAAFPYTHFLYLFHLTIFFILSGYFFKEDYVKDKNSLKEFIIIKIKRLYIPFVIGNIICVLLNNTFINLNLYDNINHEYYSIYDITVNIIKILLFRGNTEMLGATWFLPILFFISIIYATIEFLIRNCKEKTKEYIQIALSIILLCIGQLLIKKNINFFGIQILTCYIFFDLGRKYNKYKIQSNNIINFLKFITSFVILIILNKYGSVELAENEYTNIAYYLIVSILGWYFIYELSYFISKNKIMTKTLQYIGKNTMPILILHFIAFKLINILGVLILNQDKTLIAKFPIAFKNNYSWIIYTISGIILPLFVNKLSNYIKKEGKKDEVRSNNSNI